MECPSCHYVREEKDRVIPDWQCPSCGVAYAKFKAALSRKARARLVSGTEIRFSRVKLYDLNLMRRLEQLRQMVTKNLSPRSSGIGFWGDLEFVVMASAVSGLLESAGASQMAKQASGQIDEMTAVSDQLRSTAMFVHVSTVENMRYPDPSLWRAVSVDRDRSTKHALAHIASNCVFVEMEGKETALFWDKVEQYDLIED